jgi:hypothetical protein
MSKIRHERLPNGRKVIWVGSEKLQLALAEGGGNVTALRCEGIDESSNPYWQPPWPSLEPSGVTPELVNQQYGGMPEGRLLASILGHSAICFGVRSSSIFQLISSFLLARLFGCGT